VIAALLKSNATVLDRDLMITLAAGPFQATIRAGRVPS